MRRWIFLISLSLISTLVFGAVTAAAPSKSIVFLGDSLTAGYGLAEEQAYPALIQKKIDDRHLGWKVVNAGVSGDTTADGLNRLRWVLRSKPSILVIALGANDGLRGLSAQSIKENLQKIIDGARAADPHMKLVLVGMKMPPNFGARYAGEFEKVFPGLAAKNGTKLIPFLLEGVGGQRELNQPDLIHPNPAGHRIIADLVWRTLEPILRKS
ncbi:MAG: arylesterase [Elusimicrobia bacterium]|nr:arylesterase [Elusimicrobiota bacterium]